MPRRSQKFRNTISYCLQGFYLFQIPTTCHILQHFSMAYDEDRRPAFAKLEELAPHGVLFRQPTRQLEDTFQQELSQAEVEERNLDNEKLRKILNALKPDYKQVSNSADLIESRALPCRLANGVLSSKRETKNSLRKRAYPRYLENGRTSTMKSWITIVVKI